MEKPGICRRMGYYEALFLHTSSYGFIVRPSSMHAYLIHALHSEIGQLKAHSQQLQIEIGRYASKHMEEQICQFCHQRVKLEEHCVFHSAILCELISLPFQTRLLSTLKV